MQIVEYNCTHTCVTCVVHILGVCEIRSHEFIKGRWRLCRNTKATTTTHIWSLSELWDVSPSNQQQTNAILCELTCCAAEVIQYKHKNNNLECVSLFDRQAVFFVGSMRRPVVWARRVLVVTHVWFEHVTCTITPTQGMSYNTITCSELFIVIFHQNVKSNTQKHIQHTEWPFQSHLGLFSFKMQKNYNCLGDIGAEHATSWFGELF